MFTLKNVSKSFGDDHALRDISMTIGRGLNFIVGSSGSGKTTLLKILSGMEQSFEGEVFYFSDNVKTLSEKEKSYYYHNILGFVWQDFNLLDDRSVLENVMLPQYLGAGQNEKSARKLLRELKIEDLAQQKTGKLSGGQKQRVAIARELMKNPQVLLADEPTSALDEKSAKTIMEILRDISKNRTVIVVTHDTSLINKTDKVFELDKGELISSPNESPQRQKPADKKLVHGLSFKNACTLALKNIKSSWGRLAATVFSLLLAATLLLVTVSGAIFDSSSSAFDELFANYGQSILDISVVSSFMSAGGTDGQEKEEPSANVSQDIGGLYDKYLDDDRVSHIVFTQAFNDIQITADGKDFSIKSSGNVPSVNELTAGVMPMGKENEVVVPNSFVKDLGITDKEALGKTITFHGSIYNWESGNPVAVPVDTTAKIVGVADATVKYEAEGQIMEYSVDDSFFFSKTALDKMRTQAKVGKNDASFTIRAKTPGDLIALKNELNAGGIVPIGRFELVEDIVRLNDQTNQQSGSAFVVIGILSVILVLAVSLITALSRRREYAIYKISGYSDLHFTLLTTAEALISIVLTAVLFLAASPGLNLATAALWNVTILNSGLLFTGVLLILGTGIFSGVIAKAVNVSTKASRALTTGEK